MSEEAALFEVKDALADVVAALHAHPHWPADEVKDRTFARSLLDEFPSLDVLAEIAAWRAWMLDHDPKGKEVKPRARVHRWLRGARGDFGRSSARRSNRTSTAPRSVDEFGETTQELTGW